MDADNVDWKARAAKTERDYVLAQTHLAQAKAEVEHWRSEYEALLEASLLQINRASQDNNGNDDLNKSNGRNGLTSSNSSLGSSPDIKKKEKKGGKFPNLFKGSDKKSKKANKEGDRAELTASSGSKESQTATILDEFDVVGDFATQATSIPFTHLPALQVCPVPHRNRTVIMDGPSPDVLDAGYQTDVYARSKSTYPHIPGNAARDGDPICDHYSFQIFENRIVACLADGCNWGERPRTAAIKANQAFLEFVNMHQDSITDVKRAGALLLNAFEYAHKSIVDGKMTWEVGTTTLLGGVLFEINRGSDPWVPQWEFVCASVGDCKAYLLTQGESQTFEVSDITASRLSASDPCDCGGRLGPHLEGGKPDLRNLNLFAASAVNGDYILIVSDGVHDNLDPQHLGKLPKDMPREFNLPFDRWDEADPVKAFSAKTAHSKLMLERLLNGANDAKDITDRLINHCMALTKKSRDWMEANAKRLPGDYSEFPGKMDHTTCLCLKVGKLNLPISTINVSPNTSPTGTPGSPSVSTMSSASSMTSNVSSSGSLNGASSPSMGLRGTGGTLSSPRGWHGVSPAKPSL